MELRGKRELDPELQTARFRRLTGRVSGGGGIFQTIVANAAAVVALEDVAVPAAVVIHCFGYCC